MQPTSRRHDAPPGASRAAGTIDPHINYTLQYWQLYQSIYDGLVTFKKAAGAEGFTIVPDLAEELPAADRRRQDLYLQAAQGHQVLERQRADRQGRRRLVPAHLQGLEPDRGRLLHRHRRRRQVPGRRRRPARSKAASSATRRPAPSPSISTRPDAEFFDKLAVPHAVDPAGRFADRATSAPQPLPGTGAYMIATYDPNKQLKIVRNPHFKEWSEDAQPDGYPDEIDYDFGLTDEAEVTAVRTARPTGCSIRRRPTASPRSAPSTRTRCTSTPLTALWYAPMNTQHAALRQREGAPGGELRHRPQGAGQPVRRPGARRAGLPGPAAGLPRA